MINEDELKYFSRNNLPNGKENEEEKPKGLPVRDFWPEVDEFQRRIDECARRSLARSSQERINKEDGTVVKWGELFGGTSRYSVSVYQEEKRIEWESFMDRGRSLSYFGDRCEVYGAKTKVGYETEIESARKSSLEHWGIPGNKSFLEYY